MVITIFSTKAFKPTDLFGERIIYSNDEATRELNSYFRGALINRYLLKIESDLEKQHQLRDAIFRSFLGKTRDDITTLPFSEQEVGALNEYYSSWIAITEQTASLDVDEGQLKELTEKKKSIEGRIKELVSPHFDGEEFIKKCRHLTILFEGFADSKNIINDEYLKDLPDDFWIQDGLFVESDSKQQIFCIKSFNDTIVEGVFGVRCLEVPDTSYKWISTLIDCAKHLAGPANLESGLSVQLLLHDKDITGLSLNGNNVCFAEKDVYIINEKELEVIAPQWKSKGLSSLTIVFFHHTSNQFAKIVENKYDGENIHYKVESFVKKYFEDLLYVEQQDLSLYS